MRKLLILLAIVSFTVSCTTPAEARGRIQPESWCSLVTHVPWTFFTSDWKVKDRATARCSEAPEGWTADSIEVGLNLFRRPVDSSDTVDFVRAITVHCNNARYCRAIVQADLPDNTRTQWLYWGESEMTVEDGFGTDYDFDESSFMLWPEWD